MVPTRLHQQRPQHRPSSGLVPHSSDHAAISHASLCADVLSAMRHAAGPSLLLCPACHRLIHAEELKRLASDAERSEQEGDLTNALSIWRDALELLRRDHDNTRPSRQGFPVSARRSIPARYRTPEKPGQVPPRPLPRRRRGSEKIWAWIVAVVGLALTKGKLLLIGLTKAGTLWSMLLSFGVYWTVWGWKFAAGLIISIYIHEMGHVVALSRFGMKATAPMFIPALAP